MNPAPLNAAGLAELERWAADVPTWSQMIADAERDDALDRHEGRVAAGLAAGTLRPFAAEHLRACIGARRSALAKAPRGRREGPEGRVPRRASLEPRTATGTTTDAARLRRCRDSLSEAAATPRCRQPLRFGDVLAWCSEIGQEKLATGIEVAHVRRLERAVAAGRITASQVTVVRNAMQSRLTQIRSVQETAA
jgi:hypothetical protein